jgi:hypothetical protein
MQFFGSYLLYEINIQLCWGIQSFKDIDINVYVTYSTYTNMNQYTSCLTRGYGRGEPPRWAGLNPIARSVILCFSADKLEYDDDDVMMMFTYIDFIHNKKN